MRRCAPYRRAARMGATMKRILVGTIFGVVFGVALSDARAAVLCTSKHGLVHARESCRRKEKQLDPTQLGIVGAPLPGPPGPRGATGDDGPPGPVGPAGVA